tara:strand:+ start:29848 stop:31530 length:1683 start_codon:yes stop_codon:yes gene_type:complete
MRNLDKRLLIFARRLHSIENFGDMVLATANEIRESVGYNMAWLSVFDLPNKQVRVLAAHGLNEDDIWTHAPVIPLADDPYLARVFEATEPQIIRDAQSDPNVNREVVKQLGNRTIVNVPMRLVDQQFGALGTGTFGEEGVKLPSEEELAHLTGIAKQLVTASARLLLNIEREESARQQELLSRKLAERQQLESIGELAGGVAHDFNNLLTVVIASTSLLQATETDPERLADLQTILDASRRASELTRRLLALGQRQSLQLETGSVNTLVDSVVSMLRRVIPADIALNVLPAHDLPLVSMDSGQIEQVLMNLSLNAKDAMPNGGRLTLETEHVVINGDFVREHPWARPGRYILLTATDTGQGMAPKVLNRVFEPFFTTKSSHNGSGLGLSVCRGIVEQHGGMIHAYSEPDVGTTFKIYLPVAERAATSVGTKVTGPVPGGSERLLVADDEEQVRRIVRRILEGAGYSVVTVSDGALALEASFGEEFDLVILDAVMPNMGGRATFDALRAHSPTLPILFASGYGAEELSARFLSDISAPMLPKPFDPDGLLRMVRCLLDAKR